MECDFRITERRYGTTVHLVPAGEFGCEAVPVWDTVESGIDGSVAVVVCDMARVRFMDVTGLNRLIAFAEALLARGTALFVVNVRTQPAHVMDLLDDLADRGEVLFDGPGEGPTAVLRRTLTDRATAVRNRAAEDEERALRPRDAQRPV
ncbi:STAS domain-containing protein [Streptomyces virginiae]|uniref:STAS domain-containing protein n=1 Tax=Streptomyces virginiae TaxID=1961 RepID=UPI0036F95078